jgi:hypothetical protein
MGNHTPHGPEPVISPIRISALHDHHPLFSATARAIANTRLAARWARNTRFLLQVESALDSVREAPNFTHGRVPDF